jgi:hypothetical protein
MLERLAAAAPTGIASFADHMLEYALPKALQYSMSEGVPLATSCWAVAAKGRPNARLVIKQNFMIFMAFTPDSLGTTCPSWAGYEVKV